MALQSSWYFTSLPKEVIGLIEKEATEELSIPDSHWGGGFVWHYILRSNRENFLYNIDHLDGDSIKLKVYNEGEGQTWHNDAGIVDGPGNIRKLSFTIQLSDYDEYEGGNVELQDETDGRYFLPRERGLVAVFDSRTQHRVHKVTKGTRKSLVGWCVGSQWR